MRSGRPPRCPRPAVAVPRRQRAVAGSIEIPAARFRPHPSFDSWLSRSGRPAVLSGGLVDATLLGEIERAGYRESIDGRPGRGDWLSAAPPGPRRRRRGPSSRQALARDPRGRERRDDHQAARAAESTAAASQRACSPTSPPRLSQTRPDLRGRLLRRHPRRRHGRARAAGPRRRSLWRRPDPRALAEERSGGDHRHRPAIAGSGPTARPPITSSTPAAASRPSPASPR